MASAREHFQPDEVLSKALADLNLAAGCSTKITYEQEVAVRDLVAGKDVLAVLPTGFGKSLIYQLFEQETTKWMGKQQFLSFLH